MVYLGAESGSETVLKQVHKNVTPQELVQAAGRLRQVRIASSVTLISGLGGQALLKEHALASAALISAMKPDYLGFLTLMLEPGAPMRDDVRCGRMKLLTPEQVIDEMELFLGHVDRRGLYSAPITHPICFPARHPEPGHPDMLEQLQRVRESSGFPGRENAEALKTSAF